jgi:hypothetical protein
MFFGTGDTLRFAVGYTTTYGITTTRVFRDPGAWYHIVLAFDATQSTAANKIRLYVNGVEETTFSSDTRSSLSNQDWGYNNNVAHYIGRNPNSDIRQFNGYLADCYLIDGQQLDPTSFTTTDATTGQLIPKAFSGSYGTNGWHLDFADNSAATATTLGKDTSGNGNNWTPNNFSVTAGAGNDSLVDVPTNGAQTDTGAGGEVRGNYCTLNPLAAGTTTLSNGNLDAATGNAQTHARASIGITSGKWYWEIVSTSNGNNGMYGIVNQNATFSNFVGADANGWAYFADGQKYTSATNTNYGASFTNNDVIGVAFDADNGTLTFYKNGTSQGQAFSGLTSGPYFPAVSDGSSSVSVSLSVNFGQRAFAYTAPSGFKALCTTNLPAPLFTKPNTVMDVALWSGNGGSQTITLPGAFSPDFVWIKRRSSTFSSLLYDTIRGNGPNTGLISDSTTAEGGASDNSTYGYLNAFNSTGFALTAGSSSDYVNTSGQTYVGWCWDAGTSTVTNTAGSITASLRANPTAGFSIVTYTGTGSNATVGHGLGIAPSMAIVKVRNRSGDNWLVYHKSLSTPSTDYLLLSSTAASGTLSGYWNGGPTSSVLGLGNYSAINNNGDTYVAYCFAPVVGYSSFGSYTGNGASSDGPFVFTGMRPRFVLLKRTDSTGNWVIWDAVRNAYNVANSILLPNSSAAEFSPDAKIDILSNGFKIRDNSSDSNVNGATYVYAAFAEAPLNYSRSR